MKTFITAICICLLLTSATFAQRHLGVSPTESGGVLSAEQAAYDITFYKLDIAVHPDDKRIEGTLSLQAAVTQPLEWLVLDLDSALHVKSAVIKNASSAAQPHIHQNGELRIHVGRAVQPGEQISATIEYGGHPRVAQRPPWVGGFTWAETAEGEPWIATSCQNDGADLWWPCKDHPSDEPDSMAINITVPKPLIAASNGKLRGVSDAANGYRTYHWFVSTPINNYGVALNIAPYRTIEGTYTSITGEIIPLTYWVLPQNYEKGKKLFTQFSEHMAFFEKYLGPYPFRAEKYGVAETPFLGMEHQTIIAYGANYSNEPHGYDILHHHELGHEWWGNLVTAMDWRDFWLHEGLCGYMHPLYMEHLHGKGAYYKSIRASLPQIRNLKPIASRKAQTTKEAYFVAPDYIESDGDMWNKGVWILHTLRYLIGDEEFFQVLRRMAYPSKEMEGITDGGQCRFATTDDFVALCETITGKDLKWFFDVYMRTTDMPELKFHRDAAGVTLKWLLPGNRPFPMPVEVLIEGETRRIEMPEGQARIKVKPGLLVKADPQNNILKAIPKP